MCNIERKEMFTTLKTDITTVSKLLILSSAGIGDPSFTLSPAKSYPSENAIKTERAGRRECKEGTREKAHKKSPEEVQHPVLNRVCFLMKPALHCRTEAISLWSPQPAAHSILASQKGHRTQTSDKLKLYLENQSWWEETLKSWKSILVEHYNIVAVLKGLPLNRGAKMKKKSYAYLEIHFLHDLL